ncbi:hypothetical protein [Brevibacillus borstelensis]|uniref:hypothetical protein n=1 Tax=Brevibacillus borstelensis TaxID=45462 RepID=UPI0030BBBED2
MNKRILLSCFVLSAVLVVIVLDSLFIGKTDASPKFKKHYDEYTQDLAIEYAFPIEHVDMNGDLVFVTLSGITQGTEVSDQIPEIVRTINEFGGLAASKNIIEYTDSEGNVFMRIPEELDTEYNAKLRSKHNSLNTISHEKLGNIINKHDEKIKEYKAAKNMTKLRLFDNKEWPTAEDKGGSENNKKVSEDTNTEESNDKVSENSDS